MSGFAHDIAGGQGNLVITSVQSPGFASGSAGWQIRKDGSAEFNNLTIRGTFNGTDFIINSSGIFLYSSAPAAGNLTGSWAPAAGTDAFGNAYPAGLAVGLATSSQVILQSLAGIGQIAFPTHAAIESSVANLRATPSGSGAAQFLVLGLVGPVVSNQADQVELGLYSANAGSTSSANGELFYLDTTGGAHAYAVWSAAGFVIAAGSITAVTPGTGTVATPATAETWHNITLDAGWSTVAGRAAPRYRLLPDGTLQLSGMVSATAWSGGKALNSSNPLPAAYRPANSVDWRSADPVGARAHLSIAATGVITANLPALIPATTTTNAAPSGTWNAEIDGIVPLN